MVTVEECRSKGMDYVAPFERRDGTYVHAYCRKGIRKYDPEMHALDQEIAEEQEQRKQEELEMLEQSDNNILQIGD